MTILAKLTTRLDATLIGNWRQAHRLWSIRGALIGTVFWALLAGLWACWPALICAIPTPVFFAVGLALSLVLALARLTKQKGIDNVE